MADFTQSRMAGIGPAISLPIFDGGRLRGNLAGRNADYDAVVETYNQTVINALHDVADQLITIRSLAEQRKQQQLAIETTQAAYDLAILRFREGVGNYLEVLTAETQLLAQQTALGAALMAIDSTFSPAELRQHVTSPGGTTEAAICVLETNEIRGIFKQALAAATNRSEELANILGEKI